MTSVKLTGLPTSTDLSLDDFMYVVDNADPAQPVSRKITVSGLFDLFRSQTMDVNTYAIGQTLANLGNPDPTKWLECHGGTALRSAWPLLSVNTPSDYTTFSQFEAQFHSSDWPGSFTQGKNLAVNPTTGTVISVNIPNVFAVYRSTDRGLTWNTVSLPAMVGAGGGSICYGNGLFVVMLGNTSQANCYTSADDGLTWLPQAMPSSAAWGFVAWNGSIFVAMLYTGTGTTAASSVNGTTWIARNLNTAANTPIDVGVIGTTFVVCFNTGGAVDYSTNGTSWASVTPNAAFTPKRILGCSTWGFLADTTANTAIFRSTDGSNWTRIPVSLCGITGGGIISGTRAIYGQSTGRMNITIDSGLTWNLMDLPQFSIATSMYWFVHNDIVYAIYGYYRFIEQAPNPLRFGLPYAAIARWARTYIKAA
jgi:hypothetical protein